MLQPASGFRMPKHNNQDDTTGCETEEGGGGGLLAFRNANVVSDDPQCIPNIAQCGNQNHQNHQNPMSSKQRTDDFVSRSWIPREQQQQQQPPTRERSSGPDHLGPNVVPPMLFPGYGEGGGSESNDISSSSNAEGPSNRPTPNSSSGSDNRQSNNSGTGHMTSPIGSHRNHGQQNDLDPSAFFQMGGGGTGMTPGQTFGGASGFSMPNEWSTGQTGMTPVAEGMLQHLMDMQMDLRWDSTT
ncbi:hypothetical protein M426DRAFT_187121 [Hypoxylon sp. CI-4A]|nr:hypothetical protein M426DRAFT_187121 [Hypoxylon sp. CI-4A]